MQQCEITSHHAITKSQIITLELSCGDSCEYLESAPSKASVQEIPQET